MFVTFDNVFHVYLMRGFQKYARNWILTMAFWATCKIAQPIQPIWQHIFALPWSALKKPPWEFNFFHIFGIPSSSRHEKRCQMLQTLFWLFQCSKNPRWFDKEKPKILLFIQTFEPKKLEKFIAKMKTALEGTSPNLEISKNPDQVVW